MSDPVLVSSYGNAFIYYTCDRDPTASEPLVYNNYSDLLLFWWNTTSQTLWWCADDTAGSMVWHSYVDSNNLSSTLSSMGVNPSVSRARTQRTSPAFSTSYQPSTSSDTEVNLALNITSLISFSSNINIQISTDDSNWTTIFSFSKALGIGANETYPITFTVPIGSYYRIVQTSGTVASIVSIFELTK